MASLLDRDIAHQRTLTARIRHQSDADHSDFVDRDGPSTRTQAVPDAIEAPVDTAVASGCFIVVINPIELCGGAMCMQEK